MNEQMKQAWLEISQMLGEPTREELDVFLRTWQRAMEAQKQAPAEQAAQQEPVGEVNRYGLDSHGRKWHGIYWYDPNVDVPHGTKLYTSPQPAQRKPLTDDELADLWYKQSLDWMEFARAIEAAHGIKENT